MSKLRVMPYDTDCHLIGFTYVAELGVHSVEFFSWHRIGEKALEQDAHDAMRLEGVSFGKHGVLRDKMTVKPGSWLARRFG